MLNNIDISLLELRIGNSEDATVPYFELSNDGINSKIITSMKVNKNYFLSNDDRFIYITITAGTTPQNEIYLSQEFTEIPNSQEIFSIQSDIFIDKKYLIDENTYLKYDFANVSFSYTHKHPGEMGIGESIRVGTFFKTKVPILDKRGEK
ncbi:hypothetical protein [Ligilactobacillus salivarius]|uniref:hypothetical protein n=1 Tax=Ligilactobacillus salivarius TaxID=1624 RepID=UPI0025A48068|nr:hypothetical protein [Ligilactobacillus salivarius]MDM8263291.1 hypothetical protein [Ligilactobacillus salivarius]